MNLNNESTPVSSPMPEVPADFTSYNQINDRKVMIHLDMLKETIRDLQRRVLYLAGQLEIERARNTPQKAPKA